jgi:hypothetical protein
MENLKQQYEYWLTRKNEEITKFVQDFNECVPPALARSPAPSDSRLPAPPPPYLPIGIARGSARRWSSRPVSCCSFTTMLRLCGGCWSGWRRGSTQRGSRGAAWAYRCPAQTSLPRTRWPTEAPSRPRGSWWRSGRGTPSTCRRYVGPLLTVTYQQGCVCQWLTSSPSCSSTMQQAQLNATLALSRTGALTEDAAEKDLEDILEAYQDKDTRLHAKSKHQQQRQHSRSPQGRHQRQRHAAKARVASATATGPAGRKRPQSAHPVLLSAAQEKGGTGRWVASCLAKGRSSSCC